MMKILTKNKYHPRWAAHKGYMQTFIWALAVERAGSFDAVPVIKALEASNSNPFTSTVGEVYYRAEDHQMRRPVTVVIGKKPGDMKNPADCYDVLDIVAGEGVMSPPAMFGCHLGGLG